MIAVNMFELQKPAGEIAVCVGVCVQTVRDWRRVWRTLGRDGLKAKPHPGRPCGMTTLQKQELVGLLAFAPTDYGFDRHFWTTELIGALIRQRFGVDYHPDWVGEVLHSIGFSHQKPMRRARERDEARIDAWRHETWPDVLKKTPTPTA